MERLCEEADNWPRGFVLETFRQAFLQLFFQTDQNCLLHKIQKTMCISCHCDSPSVLVLYVAMNQSWRFLFFSRVSENLTRTDLVNCQSRWSGSQCTKSDRSCIYSSSSLQALPPKSSSLSSPSQCFKSNSDIFKHYFGLGVSDIYSKLYLVQTQASQVTSSQEQQPPPFVFHLQPAVQTWPGDQRSPGGRPLRRVSPVHNHNWRPLQVRHDATSPDVPMGWSGCWSGSLQLVCWIDPTGGAP